MQAETQKTAKREAARRLRLDLTRVYAQAQDGRCYLCGDALDYVKPHAIHLDHDASCCPRDRRTRGLPGCDACRRGLACLTCNLLVGYGQEDPARIRLIADRLEQAQALARERISRKQTENPALF